MSNYKQRVAANFSASAAIYDRHAVLQQQAVRLFLGHLQGLASEIPPGPILEFGCGTGALSRHLPALFPDQLLTLMDIAPGMIVANRQAVGALMPPGGGVQWRVGDAERLTGRQTYALIVSCLTVQWFQSLSQGLAGLVNALQPGGRLLLSCLGDGSFAEWRALCRQLGLPCTLNPLPALDQLQAAASGLGGRVELWQESLSVTYPSALEFFRSFRRTGTRTTVSGERLRGQDLRRLLRAWPLDSDGRVTLSCCVPTLLVER